MTRAQQGAICNVETRVWKNLGWDWYSEGSLWLGVQLGFCGILTCPLGVPWAGIREQELQIEQD